MDYLILVDKNDNQVGTEEKVKCHLPNGKLHRAFTALLFDKEGRLLLTQRSSDKMLWPGYWDGSVASHPRQSETYVSSAERRLPEELGLNCKLEYLFKFEYHIPYKGIGSENEVCGTLIGTIPESAEIKFVEEEISSFRWAARNQLLDEIERSPEKFCPWMLVALYFLPESNKNVTEAHKKVLEIWRGEDIKKRLEAPLQHHFPDKNWELKEE